MIKKLHILFVCILLVLPVAMFATHIVGGSLTYIYNGGSSYTVTLKLYRDCGPGTASFPKDVTITVQGYNGESFSPSKDIKMELGTVINVPSDLDSCATPPNPMPCTQEGTYTKTVNNLPPNPGGYHLFFQIAARNLSLSNVTNASCNCIGESFYTDIPGTSMYWNEDFSLPNGTTVDNGATAWTTTSVGTAPSSASVQNGLFQIKGKNNAVQTWTSQVINISSYSVGVNLSANLSETGSLNATDSIQVYYKLNGGALTLFSSNGAIAGDFTNAIATQNGLTGSTVQIVIRVRFDNNSPNNQVYQFDNIRVAGNDFIDNNSAVFDQSPPLFLCVGRSFSYDHSAKETDGDSLVYSFYTPYNGDDKQGGPLDPTYANNVAIFTPINWVGGYSATNPLGGPPLVIDPKTGLLTGVPTMLGQFVVGIMVKKYRDGKYVNQTLRDFQFNVVNCPEQIKADIKAITVCNGATVKFKNYGGSNGNDWYWDFGDPATTADHSTQTSPSYTYPGPGTYYVTLITGYKTRCADTSIAPVNVVSITSGFTHTAPKCVNTAVTFTQTSTTSSNDVIINSHWDFGDGATSTAKNPVHSYAAGGTYKVLLTLTTNLGCTDTVSKLIKIDPQPVANAGADQSVCSNIANAVLNGSIINAGGGTWTTLGTGTFIPDATKLNATYKVSAADTLAGAVKLVLTTTGNATCPASRDTMLITITRKISDADAGPDQLICGTTTATVSGNAPSVGAGEWSVVSGGAVITDPFSPTTTVTGLITPGASYTFRWTISNAVCVASYDDVTITVDLQPTPANAGNKQVICNASAATLAANTPLIGTGLWSIVSGNATVTTPASPNSTVTNLIAGDSVVLKWTITRGKCSTSSNVTIYVTKEPLVNAGADQSFCLPSNVQLNGSIAGGTTTGIWKTEGDGTFSPDASALNATYIPGAADVLNKKVQLVLTSTNNGVCNAATDTMNIFYTGFEGTVTVTSTNVKCYGNKDGTATAVVSGGFPPHTYFWSTVSAQTSATATGLEIGTYTVTIKNAKGCTTQATATITQPNPLAVNAVVTDVTCYGNNSGTINMMPTGGTAPYSYLCIPGNQIINPVTNLAPGTYTVTIADSNNCTLTNTYTIKDAVPIQTSFSIATVSCNGKSDGKINSSTTGGTPPYTYNWQPGNVTSPNISGLPVDSYTLTVTDKLGCSVSSSTIITQPDTLVATVTSTNVTCNNLNNGTAAVSVKGGTPAYSYSWMPGNITTPSITNLQARTYTLTVKDLKNCNTVKIVTITQPSVLTVNAVGQINVSCNGGNNGSVTANPLGGTAPYAYLWDPLNITTQTLGNISAGTYTVNVTDKNNCTAQKAVTITEPAALAVTSSVTNVTCPGGTNGSLKVTPSGGVTPYKYLWMPVNKTTATVSGLSAGTYTVTVTDAKGCEQLLTLTVDEPLPIDITMQAVHVSCFNGSDASVKTTVSGGTASYTYLWSNNAATPDINTLKAGTYTLTVTDNANCKAAKKVILTQPKLLTAYVTAYDETCNYLDDGRIAVHPNGGTPPYVYLWQPAATASDSLSMLSAGTYSVTVTDSLGCEATASGNIKEPPKIDIQFSDQINVSCFNGGDAFVRAVATGGTPNYTYTWSPGGASGDLLKNVTTGTYTVYVTDKNNCVEQNEVVITQPSAPAAVTATSTPASCNGGNDGTAAAVATGGTPPYTYRWMPGNKTGAAVTGLIAGTYTVTVNDANNCTDVTTVIVNEPPVITIGITTFEAACFNANGKAHAAVSGGIAPYTYQWLPSGGTADSALNLYSGAYTVAVKDANGCSATASANVDDKGIPKPTIFSVVDVKCYGDSTGSASVSVSGGSGNYSFLWLPKGGTNPTATHLTAGTYTVIVKDSAGCQSLATTSPAITQPPLIVPEITTKPVTCFNGNDGSAFVTATGGVSGYTYTWLPQGTTGNNISNLSGTTYTVQVQDANGCIVKKDYTVDQPTSLYITLSKKMVTCFDGNDGSIASLASGASPPYDYKWMPGNISGKNISNLSAGTYTLTVTDAKGCVLSNSAAVDQPLPVTLSKGSVSETCDASNGMAYIAVSGGTPPYSYNWPTLNIQKDSAKNLQQGSYAVIVKDINECSASATVTVTKEIAPVVLISKTGDVSCFGGTDGSAIATVTGGKAPYSYTWLPFGGNSSTASNLSAGSYTVTITDANGCIALDTTSPDIIQPIEFAISTSSANIKCYGNKDGSAKVLAAGGTPPYAYQWNPSAGVSPAINNLDAGNYTIVVTDSKNCKQTEAVIITQPDMLTSSVTGTDIACYNKVTGDATVEVKGGTLQYNYLWMPMGGNGPKAIDLPSGSYTVTVTDSNLCTTTSSITLTQPIQALGATYSSTDIDCFGSPTGSAKVSVTGGTKAYLFQWTPSGGNDSIATKLRANNYFVQVTDANGCETNVAIPITQPPMLTGSLLTNDPTCGMHNGSIISQISGGTLPYNYVWSPDSSKVPEILGLDEGTYTLKITDAKGCKFDLSATLKDHPNPVPAIASFQNVSCFGKSDGSIQLSIAQGTKPFKINWSPYGGDSIVANNLVAGVYTARVIDSLGCEGSVLVKLTEPDPLSVNLESYSDVICYNEQNGSAAVNVKGGTPSYQYNWLPVNASTPSKSDLTAGTYTVNVTDQHNCAAAISILIDQPSLLRASITSIKNNLCFNDSSGSITIQPDGGTLPYSCLWNTVPLQTGITVTHLKQGAYQVVVKDAKGCMVKINTSITQPTQVITHKVKGDSICAGEDATLIASATGGVGDYYYRWLPVDSVNFGTLVTQPNATTTYTVTAFDKNGCAGLQDTVTALFYKLGAENIAVLGNSPVCPGQVTEISVKSTGAVGDLTYQWNNNLGTTAGPFKVMPYQPITYTVKVTNHCGETVTDSIPVLITPPPVLVLKQDKAEVCLPGTILFNDSSITSNVNDPIVSWLWNFGDGTTSKLQNPVHTYTQAGQYPVTLSVRTSGGCNNNNTGIPVLVRVHPKPVAEFEVNKTVLMLPYDDLKCTNRSVGGVTYNWDFGDGSFSADVDPVHLYTKIGSHQIQLITASNYGCTDTISKFVQTDADIIFPNAFTPNIIASSGGSYDVKSLSNDVFFPYTSGVLKYKLQIFNRWGELVFESLDIATGWDGYYKGKLCEQGVYIWKANVELSNGKLFNKTGDVTLLR